MKKIFLRLIASIAACMVCTGCVMTRFSESLLECGVTYQTPDIITDVMSEDQFLWKTADGNAYLCLPVVKYKEVTAPLYVFYVPELVPFSFTKQQIDKVHVRQFLKLSDQSAQDLIGQKKDISLFDELQPLNDQTPLLTRNGNMQKISVTFNRRNLENEDQLPVWSERTAGGYFAQLLLPFTFCMDVAASIVSTVVVDFVVLPGMGIIWLADESLTLFPK